MLPGTQSLPPLRPAGTQGKMGLSHIFSENSIVESFVGKMLIFEPFQSAASFLAIKSLYSYLFRGYFDVLLFTLNCSSFLPLLSLLDSILSQDAGVKCFHFSGGLRNKPQIFVIDVFVWEKKPRIDNSVYLPFYLPVCL